MTHREQGTPAGSGQLTIPDMHVYMNGEDVSEAIRTSRVSTLVSTVAKFPEIRRAILEKQRLVSAMGSEDSGTSPALSRKGIIIDGRDIGTVVLPDADLKIYLSASPEARATRRWKEMLMSSEGGRLDFDEILREIVARDEADMRREHSPLRKADDAIEVDTTNMSLTEQVSVIEKLARERM
ncbi:hypothetical protein EV182_004541 [Spiromyces aspiralis]|uniref:Uncharacterized protein n=1 Tax=Spiromyces aspiralis TaxID=68401 RepID=A0ACC1HV34_9FUNG|nr:hypothetical protein EV182_004541 [Spiromyces aspiralis]